MRVDTTKIKKGSTELTPECYQLIKEISQCTDSTELLKYLEKVKVWVYGKCELYHWINILDRFDEILHVAAKRLNGNEYMLQCDVSFLEHDVRLLLAVLYFTTLLIEHSFSRHLYNSIEYLTELLSSENMDIVLAVLNLLYMFSKRSNFIPRLSHSKKDILLQKLFNIAERWGDPNNGLALIDCCLKTPKYEFLYQMLVEYINDTGQRVVLEIPNMKPLCDSYSTSEIVKILCDCMPQRSEEIKMRIEHRVRLVSGFKNKKTRLQFVQARLQAISVLIYSNALQDNIDKILYTGFGEELCELIDRQEDYLVDIRAAILRTLTSMLHFDRNPNIPWPGTRLNKIIYYTGAERQTGMLPILVKDCISKLTGDIENKQYPLALATSLFSLLYHLASYESGGQALIKSGMMQTLLRVIGWTGVDLEHIIFVTRAVRVIDLITNIDIATFHQSNGINVFIDRLEKEVAICRDLIRKDCNNLNSSLNASSELDTDATDLNIKNGESSVTLTELKDIGLKSKRSCLESHRYPKPIKDFKLRNTNANTKKKIACVTQRAALLKSILNFIKKSIQDHAHVSGTRNIMETSLPNSLHHIIFNAEFYGPSLFLLATDVITVYVFNEPSLLSSLQDSGLTKIILQSLLDKEVPATREVLASLPNVFSALCLNERGLMEFMSHNPFDKLLRVLLSPEYLVAMRRRRSSDHLGDTARNLGNAMDDLMKHHPYLRTDATEAVVRLLNELVRLGTDTRYTCWRVNKESPNTYSYNRFNANCETNTVSSENDDNVNGAPEGDGNENDSSGDDDEDDDELSSVSQQQPTENKIPDPCPLPGVSTKLFEREPIPLIDYILNVMKFIEAIFSNSSNRENCREFILHGGLQPLLQLLSLPNLPIDSPVSTTALAVANVAKSIFNLSHETKVLETSLQQLLQITNQLEPLIKDFNFPKGSILFRELFSCPNIKDAFSNVEYTPLLHKMSAVHAYVVMLVHLCRNASNGLRLTLLKQWGNEENMGLQLLENLVKLYISLVWESTILLSICSEETINQSALNCNLNLVSFPMEFAKKEGACLNEGEHHIEPQQYILKTKMKPEEQFRYTKCLLAASSRLGRTLAELFGTLVKLSVGTPQIRPRRLQDIVNNISLSKQPTPEANSIAHVLSSILVNSFCHENLMPEPAAKLKLTFLICSVGFTGPMLFDDKRNAFHLMLSQFCQQNGVKAFFDMFYWTLSINSTNQFKKQCDLTIENILENRSDDESDFPEGSGEFLYAWLQLLDKMVNPRGLLESPYIVSLQNDQNAMQFEPIHYLIQVHNLAIHSIRRIWARKPMANYGILMTTTIVSILKHIVKSHNFLKDQYCSRLQELNNDNPAVHKNMDIQSEIEGTLFRDNLKILTDMGFEKKQILESLRNTSSLEQAMDYLLNYSDDSHVRSMIGGTVHHPLIGYPNTPNKMDTACDLSSSTSSTESKSSFSKACPKSNEIFLISDDVFNRFCEDVVIKVFQIMENIPDIINLGAELMFVLYRRNNPQVKRLFVEKLVCELKLSCDNFTKGISQVHIAEEMKTDYINGPKASKLFTRIKVFTMLLEEKYSEFRKEFCRSMVDNDCLNSMVSLLSYTEALLTYHSQYGINKKIPVWLQHLIEFIESIDNVMVILQRKMNTRILTSEIWKWYDVSTGKWNVYSDVNNIAIKNAFNNGERVININIGRQRYTINFNCMTQVSESYGSHRPISPSLKLTDFITMIINDRSNTAFDSLCIHTMVSKADGTVEQSHENLPLKSLLNINDTSAADKVDGKQLSISSEDINIDAKDNVTKKSSSSNKSTNSQRKKHFNIVLNEENVGLSKLDNHSLIGSLVRLLHLNPPVHFDTQLAILKLCARLTKNYKNAEVFYKNGGLKILLKMRQPCDSMVFPIYSIVIMRHLLEVPKVLQDVFERVLISKASQHVQLARRDLTYVLTQLSSAVSRNPNLFLNTAKQAMECESTLNSKFIIDHSKFLIRAVGGNKKNDAVETHSDDNSLYQLPVKVIKEVLRALAQPCIHYGNSGNQDSSDNVKTADIFAMKTEESQNKEEIKCEPCCCSWHIPCTGRMHQKPYISRATLLKFLSDSVRSYPSLVPRTLVYHIYTPKDSTLVKQDQSFISFILEQFLPIVHPTQNSEVSMMTRVLISSLSDCYTQINVQTKLVDEIQATIGRILAQPDTPEKHTRLQVLTGLLPIMIDSPLLSYKNYMFEILIRRGVMTTLIKIAQCTDLSNQKTISTIQSILRPIDILLRISVSPVAVSSQNMRFIPFETSVTNHRFHPRINRSIYSNSTEDDMTLRNIIRSVFSERRQAFDFIFNNDDLFLSSADTHGVMGTNSDNDADESNIIDSFNNEYELDFDRLWDDLLQNENLRTFAENISDHSVSENIGSMNGADNDRVDNDNGAANINSAGVGSDGTSTPSESTPVIIDNRSCLGGDVSTSETDSDSNMSTENEDNNHDDEEDDDEENDESSGVQLETGSNGTRQYLEVFDHVYVPESPETASNDPDIDAEEDGSYMGVISAVMSQDDSSHNNTSSTFITCSTSSSSVDQQAAANTNFIITEQNPSELRRSTAHATSSANNTTNVNRFTSALTPYLQFVEAEDRQAFRPNMDANPSGIQDVGTTNYGRENTRRLLFLDQQYCAQVPTFNNPTEEGQVELFTQDALHWWLEEAKYFDPDSQVDACLYVGHFLMLNLLNKVKESVNKKKVETKPKVDCKKSSIPILIQASKNSTSSTSSLDADSLREQELKTTEDQMSPVVNVDNAESSSITEEEEEEKRDDNTNLNMSISEESFINSNAEHNSNECVENTNSNADSTRTSAVDPAASSVSINQDSIDDAEQSIEEEASNPTIISMDVTNTNDTNDEIINENSKDISETVQESANIDTPNIAVVEPDCVNRTNVPTTSREEITPEIRAALGDLEIPDGVDPSFLAALPPELREEVIQEHLRMQRVDQTPTQQSELPAAQYPLTEVSPEFLAALPPNIQTEVLMQQRIEQQRRTAQSVNPEDPVDTAAFFQNLPDALRQAILTDMEDSQMASLPPELAAEAQHLRRDWETRNGRRLDIQANSLNGYLSTRLPSSSHNLGDETRWPSNAVWCEHTGINPSRHRHTSIIHQQQNYGKPLALLLMEDMNNLLDPDSLSTLLLFLFIEDNKFSCSRLHAIIRNICYHAPTRFWIINALMNIIRKADNPYLQSTQQQAIQPKWLKLKVDAAFGFKSNTFVIYKTNGSNVITINPQASQQIVKNCLDLLFVLAKQFPRSFLPNYADKKSKKCNAAVKLKKELNPNASSLLTSPMQSTNLCSVRVEESKPLDDSPSTSKAIINKKPPNAVSNPNVLRPEINYLTNSFEFWDVLLNIDNCSDLRSMHTTEFPCFNQPQWEWATTNCEFTSFNDSAFAKLLEMLSFKLIRRSPQLTDLLLKLLASLSSELPEEETAAATANGTGTTDNKLSKTNMTDSNTNANITSNKETSANKEMDVKEIDSMEVIDKSIQNPKIYSKIFFHFKILIEVLTLKCGTNEGLENISKIILNICQCSQSSNVIFFQYLRLAVLGLAEVVQKEIKFLLDELQTCYKSDKFKFTSALQQKYSTFFPFNGIIQDRYTSQQIVISSSSDVEPACELQLSAIKHLLSPSSAQVYFLRTLKIFILIHNLLDTQWNYHKNKVYLSEFLPLDQLWMTISKCLISLEESKDEYAVLVLQPSVEAFFLIHASYDSNINNKVSPSNLSSDESANDKSSKTKDDTVAQEKLKCDRQKFLQFAEKHRSVLNQILRQSSIHLSDGPFAVLVDHTRILDFDVKRKYFYTELERLDEGVRREENTVSVRRASVFEDSFRALYRLTPEEWKNRFYISFEDEEGQDAGGLLREWYIIISREIFNPMYALFCVSPGDRVTYMINPSSYANPNHLSYFKFVGRVIAKAVHDNKLLECYFTRAFYKHILGKQVKYTDMESQDYEFYKGLDYLMKNDISTLGYDLTFSTEVQEFGVTQIRDLIPNGRNITVTEENKFDYVQLVCQLKMSGSIRQQLDAFLEGFYDIIPKQLISIFNEQELELLISGLPDIDIEDLKANTEYHKYTSKSSQIQWFWRALRSFDQADRARFLQFVTGTSKVPLQGFGSLEGMNGIQKFQIHRDDRSTDRLPCAHTCFNQLDLPMYKTYEKLRFSLLKAIHECSEGFGFA